jgi:hypothetical protein
MPLDETVAVIETLDRVRADWGLRFPGETPAEEGKRTGARKGN